jgi:hypothetical protein
MSFLASEAILDTGTSACFMDKDFAIKHGLELIREAHPALVEVIDGRPLVSRNVMEEIQSLEGILGDQVSHVVFNIIECPANPIVLDLPWFELHNHDVDWTLQRISSKSKNIQPFILGARTFACAAKKNTAFVIYATPTDSSTGKGM